MAKGNLDSRWKDKLIDWQASGKTPKVWCSENHIPISTFHGWRKRYENQKQTKLQSIKIEQAFVELKDRKLPDPGIILECNGVKIHLKAEFDPLILRKCLECLRGISC